MRAGTRNRRWTGTVLTVAMVALSLVAASPGHAAYTVNPTPTSDCGAFFASDTVWSPWVFLDPVSPENTGGIISPTPKPEDAWHWDGWDESSSPREGRYSYTVPAPYTVKAAAWAWWAGRQEIPFVQFDWGDSSVDRIESHNDCLKPETEPPYDEGDYMRIVAGPNVTHTYAEPGVYPIVVTAFNHPGLRYRLTLTVVRNECGDGEDNDGDGRTDHPADKGCDSRTDDSEAGEPKCEDGKDNDRDGKIDFPADTGCRSAKDDDERNPPKAGFTTDVPDKADPYLVRLVSSSTPSTNRSIPPDGYEWTVDGVKLSSPGLLGAVEHRFGYSGQHRVSLRVRDNGEPGTNSPPNWSEPVTKTVEVAPLPRIEFWDGEQRPRAGEMVQSRGPYDEFTTPMFGFKVQAFNCTNLEARLAFAAPGGDGWAPYRGRGYTASSDGAFLRGVDFRRAFAYRTPGWTTKLREHVRVKATCRAGGTSKVIAKERDWTFHMRRSVVPLGPGIKREMRTLADELRLASGAPAGCTRVLPEALCLSVGWLAGEAEEEAIALDRMSGDRTTGEQPLRTKVAYLYRRFSAEIGRATAAVSRRPRLRRLVRVKPVAAPRLEAGDGISPAAARRVNLWLRARARGLALMRASDRSLARFSAAVVAGDRRAQRIQARATKRFALRAAKAYRRAAGLRVRARKAMANLPGDALDRALGRSLERAMAHALRRVGRARLKVR